jgi:hypothetical protein
LWFLRINFKSADSKKYTSEVESGNILQDSATFDFSENIRSNNPSTCSLQIARYLQCLTFLFVLGQAVPLVLHRRDGSSEQILNKIFQCYLHEQQNTYGMDRMLRGILRNCAFTMVPNGLTYSDLRN